ncbi:hypothetical protein NQ315_017269 [Exocentrus adspersus]|uniref:Uncharacterized protein n=1 Tax=Exocentrus adspersus TaxID=1586481 RepID=A0AAV8VFM4_9CUCU|nr:hypothetical protein NQ315_017269 [Exocentrus adspersus]
MANHGLEIMQILHVCTPTICEEVKVKCKEVICEVGQVYQRRGGTFCGCCPTCARLSYFRSFLYRNKAFLPFCNDEVENADLLNDNLWTVPCNSVVSSM